MKLSSPVPSWLTILVVASVLLIAVALAGCAPPASSEEIEQPRAIPRPTVVAVGNGWRIYRVDTGSASCYVAVESQPGGGSRSTYRDGVPMKTRVVRYWGLTEWLYSVEKFAPEEPAMWFSGMVVDKYREPDGWTAVAGALSFDRAIQIAHALSLGQKPEGADVVAEYSGDV